MFKYCLNCGKKIERSYRTTKIRKERQKFCSRKCFFKVNIPWNKGLKGIHVSPKNEWKKGQHPSPKTEFKKDIKGKNHPRWKGGKHITKFGYILVKKHTHPLRNPNDYVFEHRLIVEKQIKRFLKQSEPCHHINKNKQDNRPKNLMAFSSNSAHKRFEGKGNIKPSEIIFDGKMLPQF